MAPKRVCPGGFTRSAAEKRALALEAMARSQHEYRGGCQKAEGGRVLSRWRGKAKKNPLGGTKTLNLDEGKELVYRRRYPASEA